MKRFLQIGFALGALVVSPLASAAQRTFVSTSGVNNPACSLVAPCRDFAAAIAATSSGGEVIVLDSGGYGPVAIAQSVSIIAPPGVHAGLSVFSGTGIVVNPGSGAVVLSGLTINGLGGATGIDFQSGDSLRIERTTVSGFSGTGLKAAHSTAATLIVRDSAFVANLVGMFATTSAGVLTVKIDDSRFLQNSNTGAQLQNGVSGAVSGSSFSKNEYGVVAMPNGVATNRMTFTNCVFSGNNWIGIVTGFYFSAPTTVQVTGSEISDNKFEGIRAQTGSAVVISNTTVTRNGTGIDPSGGTIHSFQDNRVFGNTTDGSFTAIIPKE